MTKPRVTLRGDRCQCKACGEAFNSTYAFDKHRRGPYTDRLCLTPLAMSGEGFERNAAGFWVTGRKKTFVRRDQVLEGDMATYYESSRPRCA